MKIRNKKLKYLFYLLFTVLLAYIICIGLAPLNRINYYYEKPENDSLFVNQFDSLYEIKEIIPLVTERIYKEALLTLSENDSIQLIVDLIDSLVCLSINGVVIHETTVRYFEVDKLLRKLPGNLYSYIFRSPINIDFQKASIVKEPIVEREAPKDSLEAASTAYKPDTLIQNPAFLYLGLDYGIKLIFEQDSNPGFYDKLVKIRFNTQLWFREVLNSIIRFITFRKQYYQPEIKIMIPAEDLRAIYRALPSRPKLVLTFRNY